MRKTKPASTTITRGILLLTTANIFFLTASFLFSLAISHNYSISAFGDFQIIIVIMNMLSIPAIGLMNLVSKITTEYTGNNFLAPTSVGLFTIILCMSISLILVSLYFNQIFSQIFNLPIQYTLTLILFYVAVYYLIHIILGCYQGKELYWVIAIVFLSIGLLRVIGIIYVNIANITIEYTFIIVIGSVALPLLFIILSIGKKLIGTRQQKPLIIFKLPAIFISSGYVFFLFSLYQSIDILYVKLFFNRELTGNYAQAFLIAKIVFFLGSCFTMCLFPEINNINTSKDKKKHIMQRGFGLMLLFLAAAIVATLFLPGTVLMLILGSTTPNVLPLFKILVVTNCIHTISYLLLSYKISMNQNTQRLVGFITLSQIVLFTLFGHSLQSIAWLTVANSIIFTILLYHQWRCGMKNRGYCYL